MVAASVTAPAPRRLMTISCPSTAPAAKVIAALAGALTTTKLSVTAMAPDAAYVFVTGTASDPVAAGLSGR